MLNLILIVLIYALLLLTFLIVTIWKKKYFVKEVYINQRGTLVFYILTIVITIGLTIAYFLTKRNQNDWKYLITLLGVDIVLLLIYAYISTACIYLKDNVLVKRNIFKKRQIKLDKETIYKETWHRKIIQSHNRKISICRSHYVGNILTLEGKIKEIID